MTTISTLRKQIATYDFLFIIDDASNEVGLAVHDRREGRNLGTWIESEESLQYLVNEGADAWLNSKFNGVIA